MVAGSPAGASILSPAGGDGMVGGEGTAVGDGLVVGESTGTVGTTWDVAMVCCSSEQPAIRSKIVIMASIFFIGLIPSL